ncbi:MAG TPA: glycoside hydrolase family 3 N-terminal domain-containing protein [Rubrobacteraceae bacterium]|nr:glycoside hydrolase family 3 N-terminal domain-containing protein [Rubrobacteraceae bacterium]
MITWCTLINPDRPAGLLPNAMWLLRRELGLDGVLVTDDLAMEGAIPGGTTAARAALAAVMVGVDLLMISGPLTKQAAAYEAVVTQ